MFLLFENETAQGNLTDAVDGGEEFSSNSTLNESFSWKNWDGVIRDVNGSARNPVKVNFIIFIFNCICFTIGLPLNCFMTATILCKKRFYHKARNIFQLVIAFCDFFTLFLTLIKIVYYKWPNEELCLIFVALAGLPYTAFFFNLLLLLIDRYVSISHALWHHRKVTVRFVLFWLIFFNLILVFAVKWPYIGQFVPLKCEITFSSTSTFQVVLFIELISCFVFHIAGFRKAKKLLQSSRSIRVNSVKSNAKGKKIKSVHRFKRGEQQENKTNFEEIEMKVLGNTFTFANPPSRRAAAATTERSRITVHRSKANLCRLEMKTNKTFLVGLVPILLLPCPLLMYFAFRNFICIPLFGDKSCNYGWLATYFRELILLHVLVYVIISIWRNNDFTWPFKRSSRNSIDRAQLYGWDNLFLHRL